MTSNNLLHILLKEKQKQRLSLQLIKNNNDTIATTAANKAKTDAQTAHMRANEKKAQSMAFKKNAAAAASDSGSDSDDE